jgi:hypothetical protein
MDPIEGMGGDALMSPDYSSSKMGISICFTSKITKKNNYKSKNETYVCFLGLNHQK